jgi:hypothetical protein
LYVPEGRSVSHVWIKDKSLRTDFPGDRYKDADGFDVNAVGISC